MHNVKKNLGIIYRICKEILEKETDHYGNFQFYPRKPVLSDFQVVILACLMDALGIDFENLLWNKLKNDYPGLFIHLICRTRFNRRRKRLQDYIMKVQHKISDRLESLSQVMEVDPVPVVKSDRGRSYRAFRKNFEIVPAKG
jgi:hypothetical protein